MLHPCRLQKDDAVRSMKAMPLIRHPQIMLNCCIRHHHNSYHHLYHTTTTTTPHHHRPTTTPFTVTAAAVAPRLQSGPAPLPQPGGRPVGPSRRGGESVRRLGGGRSDCLVSARRRDGTETTSGGIGGVGSHWTEPTPSSS